MALPPHFLSKIEWDRIPTDPEKVSCDRAIRYSGFFGVRSVGPVGDFLDISNKYLLTSPRPWTYWSCWCSKNPQRHLVGMHLIHRPQVPTWTTGHIDTVSQQKSELNLNIHMQKLMMQQLQLHKCPFFGASRPSSSSSSSSSSSKSEGSCYDLHKSKAGVTTCTDTFGWYFKNSPYCQIHSSMLKWQ